MPQTMLRTAKSPKLGDKISHTKWLISLCHGLQ
jgi:hypothetical protein